MKRLSGAMLLCTLLLLFSSCKKNSDNARHIPKNATAVFSIDMASIGKKLAWDMLFGGDMFKKMSGKAGKDSANITNLKDAGIDFMGVFYTYVSQDQRYSGGQRTVALIPLSNDGQWESYVKKTFPAAAVKAADKRKECMLSEGMYAGWNDHMLILMNTVSKETEMPADGSYAPPVTDEVQTAAEMDNAFKMSKENSVMDNKHFADLEKEGHDMSLWINYENIMNNYGKGMMGGFTMSNAMMKDAVFTSGFDFEKGAIKGAMKYYVSEELKAATKDLMNGNANKEMVQRLPANNLNMLAAMNLSPKGLRDMLDKFGLLGLINVGLAEQNLSSDDIFDSFTGDMAFTLNNFRLEQKKYGYSYYDDNMEMHTDSSTTYDPAMDWLYVMKINNQEKFDKLMNLATTMGGLQSTGNGVYTVANGSEGGLHLVVRDKYLVATSQAASAEAYLSGANKGQKLPEVANKNVYDHPFTMFVDLKQMMGGIAPETVEDKDDMAKLNEIKKLLDNVVISGGEFKDNAFSYEMSINFINKEQNSLLLLIQMANSIAEMQAAKPAVAVR